ITGGSALSKEEIDKMIKDAEQYAEEDRQRREAVETRNQADSLVYTTEKFLTDNGDKVPADVKTEVETDVEALKKALEGDDTDTIKTAAAKLAESSQKMGSAMYAQAGDEAGAADAGAPGDAGTAGGQADEDVVEAEIVDEDNEGTTDEGTTGGERK
ncbi:MAG TPA: Hsp70 family protein, partial [Nocardioidaceae bacterium]|nr:Hsp70 family protein [Nocardioidaceae bacterium]